MKDWINLYDRIPPLGKEVLFASRDGDEYFIGMIYCDVKPRKMSFGAWGAKPDYDNEKVPYEEELLWWQEIQPVPIQEDS